MKLRSMIVGGMLAAASFAIATPAHAAFIVGQANFTLGHATVSLGEVDWQDPNNPGPAPIGSPTYGGFDVQSSAFRSGVFLNPVFNGPDVLTDLIQDLSNNPADGNFVPLGVGNTPNFLKFADFPTWQFTETFLLPGAGGVSPFNFFQVGSNVIVGMSLNGIAFNTATPADISVWDLVITSTFTNTTVGALQAIVLAGGTLQDNQWGGTFTATAVPEPATLLTFGLGSMYLARRRRNQKKS